ncbi:DUF721 domain-containing protein [Streptomyces sp. NPDC058674]|uniref:DUF721 domain-containing protein n=1 Tax=Streptomyces sp. NPDC058674 TaxID=3346592 RepID=UPI003665A1E5
MSGGEVSGVDLARQALLAAREAARKNGATRQKPKRRTSTAVRRDGREPLGLGAAIGMMMTERGIVTPAVGGSVLAEFDAVLAAVVPELAGRVKATAFDVESGRLDVVPDAPAVGTQLRWSAPKLIAAVNAVVSGGLVRALHVLAPAAMKAGSAPAAADQAPHSTTPAVPVERRTPPDGYRRAIEAHRQAAHRSRVDPHIAEAVERQNRAMRELSSRAFPKPEEVADEQPAPIDSAPLRRRREFVATEAAAVLRARAERARQAGAAVILPQPASPHPASAGAARPARGCA